ncbi:NUDIX domain-containing protein [Leptodontidium sp. 2 PMI_412]|nr:NUDIX domain-containing protein [Leptodontidium sp. 2 PMI_412]
MGYESGKPRGFLDLINAVDNFSHSDYDTLYKLLLPDDPRPHGFMLASTVSNMPWSSDFAIDHGTRIVQLLPTYESENTAKACTNAFQNTIDVAINTKIFPILHGDHSEMYKIIGANYFVCLERFAAPLFGIATQGAHMNAYVNTSAGLKIWIARRSAHLFTYPNKLDTAVAGGIKAEHSPLECIVAEADEEASLPADFVRKNTRATGTISYVTKNTNTGLIHPNVLYIFDLELPPAMIPKPRDDEVSEFYLLSVEEVKQAMLRQEFKPNCALVMIDFAIRQGIITPENEDDYVEITTRLRRRLPVPTRPQKRM